MDIGLYSISTSVQPSSHPCPTIALSLWNDGSMVRRLKTQFTDRMLTDPHRGTISALQSTTKSYVGELLCRLSLGAAEAPFFSYDHIPYFQVCIIAKLSRGCIFLMSSWYRADELAHRIGILYAGVALANMYVLHIYKDEVI